MLKKKVLGAQALLRCERCKEKTKVLYTSTSGEKICEDCLFIEQCLNSTLEKNDENTEVPK